METGHQVLEALGRKPGRKAADIARELNLQKGDVNRVLYGELKAQVIQDRQYRWSLIRQQPPAPRKSDVEEASSTTALPRLCRYYLDCLSHELENGVSVFAASKFDLDYAELTANPFQAESGALRGPEVGRLVGRQKRQRAASALFVGYPTRLKLLKSRKSDWEGFMAEPVVLFPLEADDTGSLRLADDTPILNFRVLSALNTAAAGRTMEEAVQLSEELGLWGESGGVPDPEDLVFRLRSVRPEWDWKESIDPNWPTGSTPLSRIDSQGIYNRAVVIVAERSTYTRGLEAELTALQKEPDAKLAVTQLGRWLAERKDPARSAPPMPLLEPIPLNVEQRLAVQRALAEPLTVITGPPGTGKSQVVASLLVNAAYQGKKVLFASKNNKAVAVVQERVNALGARPILLRLGANEHRARLSEYLSNLLAATVTEEDRIGFKEQEARHAELVATMKDLEDKQGRLVTARNKVDLLERQVEEARGLFSPKVFADLRQFDEPSARAASAALEQAVARADRAGQNVLVRLAWPALRAARFQALELSCRHASSALARLGLQPPSGKASDAAIGDYRKLAGEAALRVERAVLVRAYLKALGELQRLPSLEDIARSQAEATERLASNSQKLWDSWIRLHPTRLTRDHRRALQRFAAVIQLMVQADETNQKVDAKLKARFRALYPTVMDTLPCWAVTSLSARGRIPLEPGFFDILVIDEASQCDVASAIPLLYRCRSAVIIGDPNQLKHITSVPLQKDQQLMAKHEVLEDHVGWSYSVTSLFDLACGQTEGSDVVTLRDHHRSHADIIGFSNNQFYEGRLRVATRYERLKSPARDEPAVRWLPVVGDVQRPSTGGAENRPEAAAVVKVLSELVLGNAYRGSIGVVSPFRAQANLITKLINDDEQLARALAGLDFQADTVHAFQGDERDLIVFSPVVSRNTPQGALAFLKNNRNLFNVAITRARAALWTVGDLQAALTSDVDYLQAFAKHTQDLMRPRPTRQETIEALGPDYPRVRDAELVSEWERVFYCALYAAGIRPIPQYPEEKYRLDFAVFDGERRLNIEVDGERYHKDWTGELCRRDLIRNQRLMELGWDVKRFWVYQIRDDQDRCVQSVKEWLAASR